MYSPFIDKKGNPLEIKKVQFKHLEQLKECEEGHHLEFKRDLLDDGKAQLAKEIASFANCEGGWLIVGIEDKTHEINAIENKIIVRKLVKSLQESLLIRNLRPAFCHCLKINQKVFC